MSNQEFYTLMLRYIDENTVVCLSRIQKYDGYHLCKVGNRRLFVREEISDFINIISEKNIEGEFLTQRQAEIAFAGTHCLIEGLVKREILKTIESNGVRFYIRKDW